MIRILLSASDSGTEKFYTGGGDIVRTQMIEESLLEIMEEINYEL